jgi:hypothetical protein
MPSECLAGHNGRLGCDCWIIAYPPDRIPLTFELVLSLCHEIHTLSNGRSESFGRAAGRSRFNPRRSGVTKRLIGNPSAMQLHWDESDRRDSTRLHFDSEPSKLEHGKRIDRARDKSTSAVHCQPRWETPLWGAAEPARLDTTLPLCYITAAFPPVRKNVDWSAGANLGQVANRTHGQPAEGPSGLLAGC